MDFGFGFWDSSEHVRVCGLTSPETVSRASGRFRREMTDHAHNTLYLLFLHRTTYNLPFDGQTHIKTPCILHFTRFAFHFDNQTHWRNLNLKLQRWVTLTERRRLTRELFRPPPQRNLRISPGLTCWIVVYDSVFGIVRVQC